MGESVFESMANRAADGLPTPDEMWMRLKRIGSASASRNVSISIWSTNVCAKGTFPDFRNLQPQTLLFQRFVARRALSSSAFLVAPSPPGSDPNEIAEETRLLYVSRSHGQSRKSRPGARTSPSCGRGTTLIRGGSRVVLRNGCALPLRCGATTSTRMTPLERSLFVRAQSPFRTTSEPWSAPEIRELSVSVGKGQCPPYFTAGK